jgi:hypothetical protein
MDIAFHVSLQLMYHFERPRSCLVVADRPHNRPQTSKPFKVFNGTHEVFAKFDPQTVVLADPDEEVRLFFLLVNSLTRASKLRFKVKRDNSPPTEHA